VNLPASWKATVMDDGENPQLTLRPRLGVRSSQDLAAPSFLDAWIERARATGIQQIITMSHTLSLHRQGLLADYVVGTSSSPLERTNNKIKTLQRTAEGYGGQEFLRLWIFALHDSRYELVG